MITTLLHDGYRRFTGYEVDEGACKRASCQSCGHVGLMYEAYTRDEPYGTPNPYRAFAVCSACGHQEDIS